MAVVQHPVIGGPEQPVVSICIANYNGERLLADCIESVLAQDTDATIEIIVHDDASTDGSLGLLRERYPRLQVLSSDRNVGFCLANNRMANVASGKFVLLLNNDAALWPDAIATLLSEASTQGRGILTLPQYDWAHGSLVDRGCLLDPFYNPIPNLDPARHDVAYVIGACLWIPRTSWQALGGFPEWMESLAEDMYLCCRARLRGLPVRVTGASGYRHLQGASFGGNRAGNQGLRPTRRRRKLSERNKTMVLAACTPAPIVYVLLPMHCILLAVEGALLSLLRAGPEVLREIYLPALLAPVRHCKRLSGLRREIQGSRKISRMDYCRGFRLLPRKLQLLVRHGLPRFSG